jgi:signal peptidase I
VGKAGIPEAWTSGWAPPRPRLSFLLALGAALSLLPLARLFLPSALGGEVNYVVVTGGSMSPALGPGDLVVARKS